MLLLLIAALAAPVGRPVPPLEEHLSASEKQERAQKALEKMRAQVGDVQKMVAQARSEKDIVKLNCTTERLALVQGLVKISEQAQVDLTAASRRKDDDASDRAYARVTTADKKITQLHRDAQQCIGQLAFFNDEKTIVDVEVPAGLPLDPMANEVPTSVIFRPPPASGF